MIFSIFFQKLRSLLAAFVLLLFYTAPSRAQEDPGELITDRPDQTESASVVPVGFVQIELGGLFTRLEGDRFDADLIEIPGTLARVGLSRSLELRLGWVGYVALDEGSEGLIDENGIGDAEVGLKYRFRDERGSSPEMALLVSGTVPVGDDEFTSDRVDPALRLAFAHTLNDRLSLGYNLGVGWASEDDGAGGTTTLSSYLYTVALGISLYERVGAFVEFYGEIAGSASGGPANSFDGGFTFLLRDNVQLDVAGGVGLSEAADEWFLGLGLTVRLPR